MHKVREHKRRAKFDIRLDHFFRFEGMPLGLPKNAINGFHPII
jgi:hypothetical protein